MISDVRTTPLLLGVGLQSYVVGGERRFQINGTAVPREKAQQFVDGACAQISARAGCGLQPDLAQAEAERFRAALGD